MENHKIIAGLYEIDEKIGAGGGGVVYLGRHMRLHKLVVLKADKRSLSTKEESLRREVDMLKNLRQTYIPQVYDFVQQDGVVYTVMDYIEGESLDKVLARGEKIPQPDIVKWSCQLLEALDYLHHQGSHGILHGDIKPANIMLLPDGDICLIDFNIALALGEDGAVKVGFSRGYASPEHYGAEYVQGSRMAGMPAMPVSQKTSQAVADDDRTLVDADRTEVEDDDRTQVDPDATEVDGGDLSVARTDSQVSFSAGSVTRSQPGVLLDARSDIYSLGATLYHLLSGRKPAQRASEVVPLGASDCSIAVAEIINKAMAVKPADRYQTAEEMLKAFRELHKKDSRMVRHKRRRFASAAVLGVLFLAGGACTFEGMHQKEQRQKALTMAEYSADLLAQGDVTGAVQEALEAIPDRESVFTAPRTAQAQKALTDALGVYSLADGYKAYDTIELPAAPFDMDLSPEGTRLCVVYGYEAAVYDLASGEKLAGIPIAQSALADCLFIDEDHILVAAADGVENYEIATGNVLWTGEKATFITISGDGKTAACVNREDSKAILYDTESGEKMTECDFEGRQLRVVTNDILADPKDNIFALNQDGSLLAVSFSDGGVELFDLHDPEESLILYDTSDYIHMEGGFSGDYFAYAVRNGTDNVFGLVDTVQGISLGENAAQDPFYLKADENGIYLANTNLLVQITPQGEQLELAYTNNVNINAFAIGETYAMAACEDNSFSFYDSGAHLSSRETGENLFDFLELGNTYAVAGSRNDPTLRIMKLENYEDTILLTYDARYVHDEARISQDGSTVMLFNNDGFRIYDRSGKQITEVPLPDADSIYDQQFRKDAENSYLEVIWYDGTVRTYSAADGAILSEEQKEAPGKDLYEEFYTEDYRVASSLHAAPVVYDAASGRELATLEEEGYLTYVTQLGDMLVTEYISTEGDRYGLLLDSDFEILARLPGLCDVWNGSFIFDYESGNLRQCRLYSIQELIVLGQNYIE
ncbi:MAG TPA: hypothetical protein DHW13_03610 [Lachnospiraceae bacterium]|uniref:protein kinase domain-containing protein n=1 Tax=Waltera sp. TaxID=2815806 RepID=UPI000E9E0E2B|nr:hypothetical protein [Lachnospiraceae bacterium]HCK47333.1 hypothetical protein [Lachnospiraceae bacterium]